MFGEHLLSLQRRPSRYSRAGSLEKTALSDHFVDRDQVEPAIAAALLFLAAEQYADAYEAAGLIGSDQREQLYESRILADNVRDLARGQLAAIVARAARWRRPVRETSDLQRRALKVLLEALVTGIELLAA
jgi:hypothetical protein